MYSKLSNTAGRKRIERFCGIPFKHPKLYHSRTLIHGADEANISIITAAEKDNISFAIWGMLPEGYQDDWQVFQDMNNTLNIDERTMDSDLWFADSMATRRCVIIVTGFFTTILRNGETYPYHIGLESGKPFYLAGIYNTLNDGFITCSLLVGKANTFIRQFQNLADYMPLTISEDFRDTWLDSKTPIKEIRNQLCKPNKTKLYAKPIEKEFFKQNISYDSMLSPHGYRDLPKGV